MPDLGALFQVRFSNEDPVRLICFKMVQCNWRVGSLPVHFFDVFLIIAGLRLKRKKSVFNKLKGIQLRPRHISIRFKTTVT